MSFVIINHLVLFALFLLIAAFLLARVYRGGKRLNRNILVFLREPLEDGEWLVMDFESGSSLRLSGVGERIHRAFLGYSLLESPYTLRKMPGGAAETGVFGQGMPPRSVPAMNGPLWLFPAGWQDRHSPEEPCYTAGRHEQFTISASPYLEGGRTIRVCLPETYDEDSPGGYDVVYALDGQNVFDAATAFGGVEWCLDDIALLLEKGGFRPFIIVGIDNGGMSREFEYTPYPHTVGTGEDANASIAAGGARGGGAAQHYRFIIEELDPLIRVRYNVAPSRPYLMGSSLGGLFALWTAIAHPGAFAGVAAVSPSIGWARGRVLEEDLGEGKRPRLWVDLGTAEVPSAEKVMGAVSARLTELGWSPGLDLRTVLVRGACHHESAWADRSAEIFRFFFETRRV